MRRVLFKISVALLTFCLGSITTLFYFTRNTHLTNVPQAKPAEEATSPPCFPGLSVEMNTSKFRVRSHFPQSTFSDNEWQNQFRVNWYSKHLKAMGEPSFLSNVEGESYRFLWLRSFHHPIAVRLWRSGHSYFLLVKQLNGAGGYEPGTLVTNRTRRLTESEWNDFLNYLEKSCYWQMPVDDEQRMPDGAQWILEGVRDNCYHIVDRQSPEVGDYREACLYLLKISGLNVSGGDIY